jgi:hypothetical protein
MFIKLTEVNRNGQPVKTAALFVNPDHIMSMRIGFVVDGVKATALWLKTDCYFYAVETPEQIMALIEGRPDHEAVNRVVDATTPADGDIYD